MTTGELIGLLAAVVILLLQANWLFADAKKHSRYPWFWGIWGLIQCPMPLIFYWLIVRWPKHRRDRRGGAGH